MEGKTIEHLVDLPQVDLECIFSTTLEDEKRLFRLCAVSERSWSVDDCEFMASKIQKYSPNQYSQASYGGNWYPIEGEPSAIFERDGMPNTVADIDTFWNASKFREPRAPFSIGKVVDRAQFERPGTVRCLHLPIKFPGSDIRVPSEYLQFEESLAKIVSFEKTVNPSFAEYYAYLTVDQRFVPKGASQRLPGAHVDGLPRNTREPEKQKIDHSYIITSNLGTRFFVHPFPLDMYDPAKINFFAAMRFFADETRSVDTQPFDISLMNAYSVHSAYASAAHHYRTFVRLEFSVLQFDRIGNAVNPFFDYKWEYRNRPIPDHLEVPQEIVERCRKD